MSFVKKGSIMQAAKRRKTDASVKESKQVDSNDNDDEGFEEFMDEESESAHKEEEPIKVVVSFCKRSVTIQATNYAKLLSTVAQEWHVLEKVKYALHALNGEVCNDLQFKSTGAQSESRLQVVVLAQDFSSNNAPNSKVAENVSMLNACFAPDTTLDATAYHAEAVFVQQELDRLSKSFDCSAGGGCIRELISPVLTAVATLAQLSSPDLRVVCGRHAVGHSSYGMLDFAFTVGGAVVPVQVANCGDMAHAAMQSFMQQLALQEMVVKGRSSYFDGSAQYARELQKRWTTAGVVSTGRLYRFSKMQVVGNHGMSHVITSSDIEVMLDAPTETTKAAQLEQIEHLLRVAVGVLISVQAALKQVGAHACLLRDEGAERRAVQLLREAAVSARTN